MALRAASDDTGDVFDALLENRRLADECAVRELELIAQACDECWVDAARSDAAAQRLVQGGHDGTAWVGEFLALELAGLLQISPSAAAVKVSQVLDLRDRHPELWALVLSFGVKPWQALKVASRCAEAGLSAQAARWVDQQLASSACGLPWGRVVRALEGLIVRADVELAAERARLARQRRRVFVGDHADGSSVVFARLDTEAALALDRTLSDVANALAARGSAEPVEQRRAAALGLLADPRAASELLAGFGDGRPTNRAATLVVHIAAQPAPVPGSAGRPPQPAKGSCRADAMTLSPPGFTARLPERVVEFCRADAMTLSPPGFTARLPEPVEGWDGSAADAAAKPPPPGASGWVPDPGGVRCGLGLGEVPSSGGASPLSGSVESIPFPADSFLPELAKGWSMPGGVARVEGIGPLDMQTLRRFLADARVVVRPVIDLNDAPAVDNYEIPQSLRRHMLARHPVAVFPFSTLRTTSARIDLDHTSPYDPLAPPGSHQTRAGNLGPLSRRAHRAKTAGAWRLQQPEPGEFVWTSPHGFRYRVTPHGTIALGRVNERSALGS